MKPSDNPKTVEEFLHFIRFYEKKIFVRDQDANGKFKPLSLDQMTPEQWAKHVSRFLESGIVPYRLNEQTAEAGLEGF